MVKYIDKQNRHGDALHKSRDLARHPYLRYPKLENKSHQDKRQAHYFPYHYQKQLADMAFRQNAGNAELYGDCQNHAYQKHPVGYHVELPAELGFQIEPPGYLAVKEIRKHSQDKSCDYVKCRKIGKDKINAQKREQYPQKRQKIGRIVNILFFSDVFHLLIIQQKKPA